MSAEARESAKEGRINSAFRKSVKEGRRRLKEQEEIQIGKGA